MKRELKGFIIGVILTTMLMSTVVFADGLQKTIGVVMNKVNITVNGDKVEGDNILYDGTTYVPLRAIAEMLEKEVGWDGDTNTASIDDKASQKEDTQKKETVEKPKEETKKEVIKEKKVTNADELENYLQTNFGTLKTVIGDTNFNFKIRENNKSLFPEDYKIYVEYEYDYFGGAMYSNKYTTQEKQKLKTQLKDHMKEIGKAAIKAMPNKKLTGSYHDSWYEYPSIQMGLITRNYYTWTNYDEPDLLGDISPYEQTKPTSTFRWYDLIDDEL